MTPRQVDARERAEGSNGVPIDGDLLSLDQTGEAERDSISLRLEADTADFPAADDDDAPNHAGASLMITNPATREHEVYELPKGGWVADPVDGYLFAYLDESYEEGPCEALTVSDDGVIEAVCSGDLIEFTLDEPSQEELVVELHFGDDRARVFCARFGGSIEIDQHDRFRAVDAPAPAACPIW